MPERVPARQAARPRRLARPRLALLVLVVSLAATSAAAAQRADARRVRGAHPAHAHLLDAIERSSLVVVGRVGEIRKLDAHGYSARIFTETAFGSDARDVGPGTPFAIAWEELSPGRPVRFEERDRVLVCLEPLSTASLWRARLPDPTVRRSTRAVAQDGEAFVRRPSPATVDTLTHFLALAPADRRGPAGVAALVALTLRGEPALSLSAAARLASIEAFDAGLAKEDAAALVAALLRPEARGDLGDALVLLISHRGGPKLEAAMEAARENAPEPGAFPARFYEALAALRGELPAEERRALLASEDPALRVIAAQHAAGKDAPAELRALAATDPAAAVRKAAVERLVAIAGPAALPDAIAALADPDPLVRNAAALDAAGLGPEGIAALRTFVFEDESTGQTAIARSAAIGGLARAGRPGRRVLVEIAQTHTDPNLSRLATLALGHADEPHH